jgi:hypothetical protein
VHGNKNDPPEPFAAVVASGMDEFLHYSPTKQKESLTWVEVSGKTKALTQSGNHYKRGAVAHRFG